MKNIQFALRRTFFLTILGITWILMMFFGRCKMSATYYDRLFDSYLFLICLFFISYSIWFTFKLYKQKQITKLIMGLFVAVLPAIVLFKIDYKFLNKDNYYFKFNKKEWQKEASVLMARDLISNGKMIGLSKRETEQQLKTKSHHRIYDSQLEYDLGNGYLIISLNDGKVESLEMSCID